MKHVLSCTLLGVALCALAVAPAPAGPLAKLQAGPAAIEWQPALPEAGLTLIVSGPEGFYLRQELAPGQSPSFSVFDEGGSLRPAGAYVWELRAVHTLDEGTRQELEGARSSGDEGALQKAGKLPAGPTYESGSFSILDGAIVAGGLEEPARPGTGGVLVPKGATGTLAPKTTINDSLCVGNDCPAAPAFGDSTILMMENNTRIKFGDTSNSPFPNNDWEIEANSASSGGLSYLGFNDCGTADNDGGCVTDLVFAVEAGARQNALYVESDGDVGIGSSNPVVDLHIVTGNTPAMRLEQDSSSGFGAQAWDVAGNETSFFVRDVTGASGLPFRIFPGAGSNALVIDGAGEVGVGTASPQDRLHVASTADPTNGQVFIENASGTALLRTMINMQNNGGVRWQVNDRFQVRFNNNQFQFDNTTNAGNECVIDNIGNLTCLGVKNFAMVDPQDVTRAIYYAALEGPEAGTYYRGTGKVVEGEAVIDLPDHFSKVTEAEGMTVQLTSLGGWHKLFVAEKSPERLVIRDAEGADGVEFDFIVYGIRRGYSNYQVERSSEALLGQ